MKAMRKIISMLAVVAMIASCSNNKSYTVTGKIEGGANGDTVYLQKAVGRSLAKLDSAVIENGKFTFKGVQDTAAYRYITYSPADKEGAMIDFFLENGKISINIATEGDNNYATGTPNNNAYQEIREKVNEPAKLMMSIYNSISNPELTDEQRAAKMTEMNELQDRIVDINVAGISKNITNAVGAHLIKRNHYYIETQKLDSLLSQLPAELAQDENIIKITERVKKMMATAEGQKFVDFAMLTPDGDPIKLSDYAGKGKYVLVDFWASWCGPCRRDMPQVVEAYAKYKNKNFEIVGVSLDRDNEAWKASIKALNITWPQMSDLKYWDCEGAQLYGVSSIPYTVLIDGEGTIVARGLSIDKLTKKLTEIFE